MSVIMLSPEGFSSNEDEDEVEIDEPPPKRPSKHELCHAIDVLRMFSLLVEVDIDSLKSTVRNLSRIIDSDRLVEKGQGVLTDYFSKKVNRKNSVAVA